MDERREMDDDEFTVAEMQEAINEVFAQVWNDPELDDYNDYERSLALFRSSRPDEA